MSFNDMASAVVTDLRHCW